MDAESRILGRQLRGAFRRTAKRSNEAALEGELINLMNLMKYFAGGCKIAILQFSNKEVSLRDRKQSFVTSKVHAYL